MPKPLTRLWALAIIVFLIAAQVHVWTESSPARVSSHACQVCVSGGWAIVSGGLGLEVNLRVLRLEAAPPQALAKHHRSEASAPRAPPQA